MLIGSLSILYEKDLAAKSYLANALRKCRQQICKYTYSMKVTVNIDRQDLIRLNIWAQFHLKSGRIWTAILFVGIFAFIAVSKAPTNPIDWGIAVLAAAGGTIGAQIAGLLLSIVSTLFMSSESTGTLGQHIYSLSEQGLHEVTQANETICKWSGIQSIRKTKEFIFIQVSPYLFHIIPHRSFAEQSEFEAFWLEAERYLRQAHP